MKATFTLVLFLVLSIPGFSQTTVKSMHDTKPQDSIYSFAYILIEGKAFSKKLKVTVDLGDSPQQLETGKLYSEKLTNTKSYAAVLNYMVENQFELVSTLDYTANYAGSGGTSGIVFIMKKIKPKNN